MVLTTNLLRYFKLDENAANTTVVDATSTSNGTASTNTNNLSTSGIINTAFNFNGSTEFIDIGTINESGDLSIQIWAKMSSGVTTGEYSLFSNYNSAGNRCQYQIKFNAATGNIAYDVNTTGSQQEYSTSFNLNDNSWHHIIITVSSNTLNVYVDGVYKSTFTIASRPSSGFGKTSIGRAGDFSASLQYNGDLDEAAIWDRTLTDGGISLAETAEGEIAELYNSGAGLAYPFSVATLRKIKLAGTFVDKPILTKVSGTFVDKPIKIKVGGTFQDA